MTWVLLLLEQADKFSNEGQLVLPELATISAWLRKEREFSFYGDIDFIPTDQYTRDDAEKAMADALRVLDSADRVIKGAA